MNETVKSVQRELAESAEERNVIVSARYYKKGEEATVRGVKMVEVTRLAKTFLHEIKEMPKAEVFEMCEQLWQSGYLEDALVACMWSEAQHKRYASEDMDTFERLLDTYVRNWGDCDTLCNHTIGPLLIMYPKHLTRLKDIWTSSPNRWVRRGAAASLIVPARRGLFLSDIFEVADRLLPDADDMVRKGYGWMLKTAADAHMQEVFDYVMRNRAVMPRTALRYAIEKMPADMRAEAMKK
ncbi:MAG: DNA alkylation repair protein [Rikenellaceae bacterium]|nr:DNA alkylation repair protein [Rikenellaceae bacterium]MCL2692303.1 DNA alkylation repair protein [Rikenellaceae bacterium]